MGGSNRLTMLRCVAYCMTTPTGFSFLLSLSNATCRFLLKAVCATPVRSLGQTFQSCGHQLREPALGSVAAGAPRTLATTSRLWSARQQLQQPLQSKPCLLHRPAIVALRHTLI